LVTRASSKGDTVEIQLPQARIDYSLRKILSRCAAAALFIVVVSGAVETVGWAVDISWIKHPIAHQPSMPPGAAILFFVSSVGLLIMQRLKGRLSSIFGLSLACLVGIAGGVTFLEHTLEKDWQLAYTLYQQGDSTPLTFPGPMQPDTSLSFFILGICLMLFTFRQKLGYRPMQLLALLMQLPHIFIFMCKICGLDDLCAFFGCIKLSAVTSLTFVVYCFGLLFLDASQGLTNIIVRDTTGGKFVRRICSGALAVCAVVPFLAYAVRMGESNKLFDETIASGGTALIGVLIVVAFVGWFFSRYDVIESQKIQADVNEQRVRAIINGVPVGLVSLARSGVIEFINPAAAAMFHIDPLAGIGKHISDFFVAPKNLEALEFWVQLQDKPKGFVSELTAKTTEGTQFPAEFSLADFEMPDGPRFLASILDVTSRYEIQQLRQAFVAMVSHELRTPLTSIGGFLNLLAMGAYGNVGEKVTKSAGSAEKSVKRLMNLINDLLDLEQLESGTISLSLGLCELATIIEDTCNSVNVFAASRSVTLRMPEQCAFECTGDANRIVQVLVNLISNAVKFSPADSTVDVEVEELDHWLKFKVVDRGRGVPARFRESIFERFQQVEAADTRKKGGTGLGLAICKAIIEQHGGSIGVDSVEGEGSTFWFTLPYEKE